MCSYTLIQWILFFFIYCASGWCIESTYVSVKHKKLVNRGFLRLPTLPLYGTGAVLILFITLPYKDEIWKVYIGGTLGATMLEYITGLLMEGIFKIKYWDYSDQKLHFQGRICVSSSLFWGVLSVLLTEYIHKPIERFVLNLDEFIEDHTPAKETIESLRNRIIKLTNEKEGEISRLAKVRSRLVKVYPSAYSKKFNNALKELREKIKRGGSM